MKEKEFNELINNMQSKLGEEASGLIADDLGMLISDNKAVNDTESKYQDEIKMLRDQKEKLIATNGNLLQQISFGVEEQANEEVKEEPRKHIDFREFIDSNGNFKR